uniref:Uncharacterized protein n=1 Tax=Chenopodium quinoa TaxID=63459 RepID=A0A803L0U8_CHEQI
MVTRRLPNEFSRPILITFTAMVIGYVIGTYVTFLISASTFNTSKYIPVAFLSSEPNDQNHMLHDSKMPFRVETIPRGAESLPSGIIASQSDFYLRRLWGNPDEDVMRKPKYLVTFTVGIDMKDNIDVAVKKFSDDFSIMLFHYDGKTSDWDQFEWSKRAIHVNVLKQTK